MRKVERFSTLEMNFKATTTLNTAPKLKVSGEDRDVDKAGPLRLMVKKRSIDDI